MSQAQLFYRYQCRHSGTLMIENTCDQRRKIARKNSKQVDSDIKLSTQNCLDCVGAKKLEKPIAITTEISQQPELRPERQVRRGAHHQEIRSAGPMGQSQVRGLGKAGGQPDTGNPASLPGVQAPGWVATSAETELEKYKAWPLEPMKKEPQC